MKAFRLAALLVCLVGNHGCVTTVPSVQGKVTDLVSGQPIADVDVIVLYFVEMSEVQKLMKGPFGHYYPGCAANRITKTDADGHYRVDALRLSRDAHRVRYSILLYKDGYREGSPGRHPESIVNKKMTAEEDVYEWDEGYQKKRDYTGVKKGWGSIERFQKTWLTPNGYLASKILGSDNDHQYLFNGCGEKGQNDPGLNAFAQKFILQWLDTVPTDEYLADYRNTCGTVASYVVAHPEFKSVLHATETRSKNLKALCKKTWSGDGRFDAALGIE